jgi:hypothetical protein
MPPQPLDYRTASTTRRRTNAPRIAVAGVLSAAVGVLWEIVAVKSMGGRLDDTFRPYFVLPGILAGVVAGSFTIWTRHRTGGRESILWTIATYYIGIFCFGGSLFVAEVIGSVARLNPFWASIDISHGAKLFIAVLVYGTFPFGIVLLPLCLLSRLLVWHVYRCLPGE